VLGTAETVAAIKRIPSAEVQELDSGCCGMAGSFGYEYGHYELSVALANRVLIPAAAADPGARLLAPGFSCRSQLHGVAQIDAQHPIQFIAEQIEITQ
jgi:Fe-S oxidoreductase